MRNYYLKHKSKEYECIPFIRPIFPETGKLNREIQAGLSEVRRHLKALEETEKSQQPVRPSTFSDLLDRQIKNERP